VFYKFKSWLAETVSLDPALKVMAMKDEAIVLAAVVIRLLLPSTMLAQMPQTGMPRIKPHAFYTSK